LALKHPFILFVAFPVSLQLWKPKVQPRLGKPRQRAGRVTMPETAVDENNLAELSENQVRVAG
jgi:hypothetical protein